MQDLSAIAGVMVLSSAVIVTAHVAVDLAELAPGG